MLQRSPALQGWCGRIHPIDREVIVIDRNELVISTNDAATLSAVLATLSTREPPAPGAVEELADMLESATLVPHGHAQDIIGLDTEVTYVELPRGHARTVRLVHPATADASRARVSVFAPVARALLGRRAGARVPVALPDAQIDELHVVSVRPAGRRQ
jgi:transcription elongation GreA/GreB family factor